MPNITRSALVPYSHQQMFALVNDVDAYQDFLPWCSRSSILSRDQDEIRATVELAKGSIHKSFTTSNRFQQDKIIEMRLIEGPFKQLHGFWRFDALPSEACKVTLDLDYEFSNRIMEMAIGSVFNQVANSLVDAFVERAKNVYG